MISMIAAMTTDRVLGKAGQLPWHVPGDLKNFKKVTTGHVIVMGRKTFDAVGRPLPKRRNIVISRSMSKQKGIEVYRDVPSAMAHAVRDGEDVFIVGGAEIYLACMPYADTMHLSFIKDSYDGDAFFPSFDGSDWRIIEETDFEGYVYRVYRRISRAVSAARSR